MKLFETGRVDAIKQLNILDTEKSTIFDNLTKLAVYATNCPIVFISLIDQKRQWFKSTIGLDLTEVSLDDSICKEIIGLGTDYLEILNAQTDPRFQDNKFVKQNVFSYYLAVPLLDKNGFCLGTFCVMHPSPRTISACPVVKEQLTILAAQAVALMEHHKLAQENEATQKRLLENSRASLINEMTHGITHEINNPLTVLMSGVDIVEQTKASQDPTVQKVLASMRTNISAIQKVVEAMKSNNVANNNLFGTVESIIRPSFEMVFKKFSDQKVKFAWDGEGFGQYKISQSTQQVVFHLLQNAAFASLKNKETSPQVKLHLSKYNETLILKISDSGTGVPEDKVPTLFKGLFHSNYQGEAVGIGLNTCKRIIESINGSIRFVSNHPTTFEVGIPIKVQ